MMTGLERVWLKARVFPSGERSIPDILLSKSLILILSKSVSEYYAFNGI